MLKFYDVNAMQNPSQKELICKAHDEEYSDTLYKVIKYMEKTYSMTSNYCIGNLFNDCVVIDFGSHHRFIRIEGDNLFECIKNS